MLRKVTHFPQQIVRNVAHVDEEVGRRIRAARAYADIKQPELAQQLGVSRDTLYRLEKGGRNLRPLEDERALLERIGTICGLPVEFFTVDDLSAAVKLDAGLADAEAAYRRWEETGEEPPAPPDPVLERLDQLEATQQEVLTALRSNLDLEGRITALADLVTRLSRQLDQQSRKPGPTAETQSGER